MTFCVAQLGARMHYAVPRILAGTGRLERLFTDICAIKGWPRLLNVVPHALRVPALRRLLARVPVGVPSTLITSFNGFGREYAWRRARARTTTETTAAQLWAGAEFCRRVVEVGLGSSAGVYCCNSAGLEIFGRARSEGRWAVMEQTIAPKRIERELLAAEQERFPHWEVTGKDELSEDFIEREAAEWRVADKIICGSEFVKEGIARCGGPVEKCAVIPYGVELSTQPIGDEDRIPEGPLRVLTVGTVGLRKGSPYVLEAAKRLKGMAQFRMVGSFGISTPVRAELAEHVQLVGPVPRLEVAEHYHWADVFLLPSICEGSATVTYEALAYGLPVVCTPNTGSVVRDGEEGFIVSIRDAAALVERLGWLATNRGRLQELQRQARGRSRELTLEHYGQNLMAALGR